MRDTLYFKRLRAIVAVFLFLVLTFAGVKAQSPSRDAAGGEAGSHSINDLMLRDTGAINQKLKAAGMFKYGSSGSPEGLYEQALDASRRLKYAPGIYRSLYGLAQYHSNKNGYTAALNYATLALPFCAP